MSTQHPSDFIGSLVEMAKAYEELPKVQAEREEIGKLYLSAQETVQAREESILALKAEIADLQSSVRSLEVERDDAQFHSLEADDRTQRALDFIKATFGNAGSLIQALEPAKAVEPPAESLEQPARPVESMPMEGYPGNPIPGTSPTEPEGLHTTSAVGQSEPLPSSPLPASVGPVEATSNGVNTDGYTSANPAPEVVPAHPTSDAIQTASVSESNASPSDVGSTDSPTSPGRFSGKRYSEVSGNGQWPSKDEWLSNGGTLDNFYA